MNSSLIFREGCSLKTEFIKAILAALRRASALVGQFCKRKLDYLTIKHQKSCLSSAQIYSYEIETLFRETLFWWTESKFVSPLLSCSLNSSYNRFSCVSDFTDKDYVGVRITKRSECPYPAPNQQIIFPKYWQNRLTRKIKTRLFEAAKAAGPEQSELWWSPPEALQVAAEGDLTYFI